VGFVSANFTGLDKLKHVPFSYRTLRWLIIGWITLSTILNYMDRQTLSVLAPLLRDEFKLSNEDYSHIVSAFLVSYTIMYTIGGRFVDWVGERMGMAACIIWWSIATMLHSLARGAFSLGIFRFILGIGEPGNYPAALRATTSWFPKSERGLPIAIYSSGSAVGAIFAPPLIAWLTKHYGWRFAFFLPGFLGLVWVVIWLWLYRSREPYNIKVESPATKQALPRWIDLLKDRNVLAIFFARLLADPVWYFYLFWTPEYLKRERGFSIGDIGLYGWIPFVAAGLGGVLGGWLSDKLIKSGTAAAAARRRVLYFSAAMAPIGMLTGWTHSTGAAIALIAVAGFVCFVWFINTAALVSDIFPEQVVGSVQGLIGTSGSGGGVLFNLLVGFLLDRFSYTMVFLLAGSMHLFAALVLRSLMKEQPS
jgi:ACS family hexuronate transporter-like MFS transporter